MNLIYKKATIEDIDILTKTRVEVLPISFLLIPIWRKCGGSLMTITKMRFVMGCTLHI